MSGDLPPPAPPAEAAPPDSAQTAGGLLRSARQAQGLHIAALASMIKVAPRKLELLEADRFDELPDATFTRALAQTVCRTLKIDAAAVLALLPTPTGQPLDKMEGGLNASFKEKPGRREPGDVGRWLRPAVVAPVLVLFAAVAVYLVPAPAEDAEVVPPEPVADAASAAAPVEPAASELLPSLAMDADLAASAAAAPALPASVAAGGSAAAAPAASAAALPVASAASTGGVPALLEVRATEASWVEVQDARSAVLLARTLQPQEVVPVDGVPPLRLTVGNAAGTEVRFRGRVVELQPSGRGNVARIELK